MRVLLIAVLFIAPCTATVTQALRQLPITNDLLADGALEFRVSGGNIPDASAHVEPYGLYFCDNGGAGRECLGFVVARLVTEFGAVTVADLE